MFIRLAQFVVMHSAGKKISPLCWELSPRIPFISHFLLYGFILINLIRMLKRGNASGIQFSQHEIARSLKWKLLLIYNSRYGYTARYFYFAENLSAFLLFVLPVLPYEIDLHIHERVKTRRISDCN